VKFPNLDIQNFLTIADAELSLADRGLVLVSGQNDFDTSANSNVAGKSTIADALSWCLFGLTARGESGDDIINNIAGKDCRVAVEIQDGSDIYTVERHRKHKIGKNGVKLTKHELGDIDLTKGTDKLTQVEIEKVIGCTHDVFCASIYAGQDKMPDLPGMTDRNLKTLVEEAAGTTILERAYEEARARLNRATRDVSDAANAVGAKTTMLDNSKNSLDDLEVESAKFISDQAATISSLTTRLDDKVKEVALHTAIVARESLNKAKIETEIKALDAAINAVSTEQATASRMTAERNAADMKVMKLRTQASGIKTAHDAAVASLTAADHKVGCPCDECGRPLTATEVAPLKASITAKIVAHKASYNALRVDVNSALADAKKLADDLDRFVAAMTDTTKASAQRAPLYRELNAIKDQENNLRDLKREEKNIYDAVELAKVALNPYDRQIAKLKSDIVIREGDLETAKNFLTDMSNALAVSTDVAKVFSPTGARGQILDEVTPYLNDKTATYLATLSDGNLRATWTTMIPNAKGELREKFGVTVENATGGKSFGLLSGGEKRKVRIATALALQDLVATRASKKIELFIGDEIDNALDPAGIERLMTILEEKARERGSVFMISHSDLKQWISQQLTVIKDASGVSHIEEIVS